MFDNADFDVRTIDEFHTLQSMGGTKCVTPTGSMVKSDFTERLKKMAFAKEIFSCSSIPVKPFMSHCESGLKNAEIEELRKFKSITSDTLLTLSCLLLWMSGKWLKFQGFPQWNGFMEAVTSSETLIQCPFTSCPS